MSAAVAVNCKYQLCCFSRSEGLPSIQTLSILSMDIENNIHLVLKIYEFA